MGTQPSSPVTIRDVAQAAGVHVSTVSRALSPDKRGLISEEVLRVVEAAAQRLLHALPPGHAGGHGLRPGEVRDAPVATLDEVVHRQLHRQPVVADHRRHSPALVGAVDQHGAHAGAREIVQ